MAEEGLIPPADPELRRDFIWQQAPWPTRTSLCFYSLTGANSLLAIDPFVFPAVERQKKLENKRLRGRHVGLSVGHFFFLSLRTATQITLCIKEQTQHLNTAVIYCLWKENTQKNLAAHLCKLGTNGLPLHGIRGK